MKKILLTVLSAILLLSGCRFKAPHSNLALTDTTEKDPYQWASFYFNATWNRFDDLTLSLADGSTLHWNGSEYRVTDTHGEHSYQYLLEFTDVREVPGGWNYTNEYVLTDDAGLTLEEFRRSGAGKSAYSGTYYCASADVFGQAPEAVNALLRRRTEEFLLCEYLPCSVFEREFTGSMDTREEQIRRWDYSGELLCEFHAEGYTDCFAELKDGGFLTTLHNTSTPSYQVLCHNPDGSTRWSLSLGAAEFPTIARFLTLPDGIYGFGTVNQPDSFRDIYICHISSDGKLLQEVILGGTDFEDMDWCEISDDGFILYGSTQSRDGDFPFSQEGYGVEFRLALSRDLEILSAMPEGHGRSWIDLKGYWNGQPIFFKDRLLTVSSADVLPAENLYVTAVFPCEEGYVILRKYEFGRYPYQDPLLSYSPSYYQIIATGYDAQGIPLWQTVGSPQVG